MMQRNNFWMLALTLLALGGGGWYAYSLVSTSQQQVANYLARELDTLPDDRVPLALAQLPSLGEPGLAALVQALAHDRIPVARGAAETLAAEVDVWRQMAAADSSPHVALLARLLAARVEGLTPAGRRQAAALADQLLEWPIDSQAIDGTQLISDCETILRSARESVRVARTEPAAPRREARISSPESMPSAAAADVPINPIEVYSEPKPEAAPRLRPLPLAPAPIVTEFGPSAEPTPRPSEPAPFEAPIAPRLPRPANLLPDEKSDDTTAPKTVTAATYFAPDTDSLPLSLLTDFAVMQALHGEEIRALKAVSELGRRGYTEANIELARRVTDPDPAVRRQLCDLLAQAGPEARPWLKQLAQDAEVSVRSAAIAVLSTSRDPETQEFLRGLSLKETEKPVRKMLDKSR